MDRQECVDRQVVVLRMRGVIRKLDDLVRDLGKSGIDPQMEESSIASLVAALDAKVSEVKGALGHSATATGPFLHCLSTASHPPPNGVRSSR